MTKKREELENKDEGTQQEREEREGPVKVRYERQQWR